MFYETFKDEPIPHKNFMLLGGGSHEIPDRVWPLLPPPPLLVSHVGTNNLSITDILKEVFLIKV